MCDTMSCEPAWFYGPAGKGRVESSPVITVPAAARLGLRFQVGLGSSHAHSPMNSGRRNTHIRALPSSCGLFTWDHDTSTRSECHLSGRKGTRYTKSGWRAVGIDPNPAQFFFCLIEAHHDRKVLFYFIYWPLACVLQRSPSSFSTNLSRLRLPHTHPCLLFQQQSYRFKDSRWSPLVMLCRKI